MRFDEKKEKIRLQKSFGLTFLAVENYILSLRFCIQETFITKQSFDPKIINDPNQIVGQKKDLSCGLTK